MKYLAIYLIIITGLCIGATLVNKDEIGAKGFWGAMIGVYIPIMTLAFAVLES